MKYIFLSEEFYADYPHTVYPEIEEKQDRPYVHAVVSAGGHRFAIPLRSNINHENVLWSDKENHCGLDFSKAVLLTAPGYIDISRKPFIRPNEFKALKGKDYDVEEGMKRYIRKYKKAKKRLDVERNRRFCAFSTLQYFEEYL